MGCRTSPSPRVSGQGLRVPCPRPRQPPVRSAPQLRGPLSAPPLHVLFPLPGRLPPLLRGWGFGTPFASHFGQPFSLRKPLPFPRVFPERPWAPQGQEQVTFKVFGLRPEDLAG